jgi:hypothetical protein
MPNGSFADRVRRWERLVQTLSANTDQLPGVADILMQLQDLLERTRNMQKQEDATQAQFRDTVALRQSLDKEGEDLRIRIMHSLKGRYGLRADKLYEFGMRPAKPSRARSKTPAVPPPGTPPPTSPQPGAPAPSTPPSGTSQPNTPQPAAAPAGAVAPHPSGLAADTAVK